MDGAKHSVSLSTSWVLGLGCWGINSWVLYWQTTLIPSWELTCPIPRHFWRWCSFSKDGNFNFILIKCIAWNCWLNDVYIYICEEVGVTLTILPYLTFWTYVDRIACKGLNVNLKYECPFPQFPVPYVFRTCCSRFPVYQVTSPYSSNIGYNIYCRKLRGGYQLRK